MKTLDKLPQRTTSSLELNGAIQTTVEGKGFETIYYKVIEVEDYNFNIFNTSQLQPSHCQN